LIVPLSKVSFSVRAFKKAREEPAGPAASSSAVLNSSFARLIGFFDRFLQFFDNIKFRSSLATHTKNSHWCLQVDHLLAFLQVWHNALYPMYDAQNLLHLFYPMNSSKSNLINHITSKENHSFHVRPTAIFLCSVFSSNHKSILISDRFIHSKDTV
jgi:hypothetical protein